MEGWDASTVDTWKEEFLCDPRQPDDRSCGVYICMVKYIIIYIIATSMRAL